MHQKQTVDIIVIGGGPAGLASAVSAKRAGAGSVLLIERDHELGGILPQCIHTGFGLSEFKEELTGPEYAARWIQNLQDAGVEFLTNTMVLSITRDKEVTIMGVGTGIETIRAKAIILAMGCREKTRGALGIPGYRPAGIYTAGCAQRLVNIEGFMPGRRVVILGSGDIGLIMARRLTLEGAKVIAVCERMDKPGGLARNVQQCLNDFNIPLILSSTIIEIHGRKRVEGVTIGKVFADNKAVPGTLERIDCDTVLLSVGLIPENELSREIQIEMDPVTGGPLVDAVMQTSVPGIFACGNVLKVYDLVDHVTEDAVRVGEAAALHIQGIGSFIPGNATSEVHSNGIPSNVEASAGIPSNVEASAGIPSNLDTSAGTTEKKGFLREIICTVCPIGCKISIGRDSSGELTVEGNTCKRGYQYAMDEMLHPKRTLTTMMLQKPAVCVEQVGTRRERLIAVRSSRPVPLDQTMEIMNLIRRTIIIKAVREGDVLLSDVLGTGADIIVTRP